MLFHSLWRTFSTGERLARFSLRRREQMSIEKLSTARV
jgi:hypothetical protein